MGVFVNHRPFKEMEWIRVNFGMAIGSIENTLVEPPGGGEYKLYIIHRWLGIGQQTKKGLVFGVDFGLLYGPIITDSNKIERTRAKSFTKLSIFVGFQF